jgi:AcrR family transcriptional regulator
MGIKERHERDREAISRAILDAARELFVAEGYQQVSIRKIAERIEYSPAAIYGYFASKDDIFFALAEEGFRLLSQAGDPANRGERRALEPLDRIRASFWRLYEFSREQPQYFALMFVDRSVPRITREYDRFTFVRDMKSDIVGQIQECIDAGSLPSSVDPSVACRLLTMAVIGVAVMRLSDRLAPAENADDLASDVLNVTIAGLQAGVRLQSTVIECAADETSSPAKVF